MKKVFLLFAYMVFGLVNSFAGTNSATSKWSSDPFADKVFVENKGQFNGGLKNKSDKILFEAVVEGVEVFFTPDGLTYRYNERVPVLKKENEVKEKEEGEVVPKIKPHYLSMQWQDANPNAEIISEEPVSYYYTYGGGIKATAYKKITYKNIYPNIDAVYIFPEDSSGIKYSLLLHPGANAADIKMKWKGNDIILNQNGNLNIKSSFGEFIDHAPQTYYENGGAIVSAFHLNGSTVSFYLQAPLLTTKTIVIDPWVSSPTFTMNNAYDVNYDYNGNVYVYGSWTPTFQLAKFNSAGVLQWKYNAYPMMMYTAYYGDFTVDPFTGSSYLGEGCDENFPTSPPRIIKINTAGMLVDSARTSQTAPYQFEIWRMDFDLCTRHILAAGGGIGFNAAQATIIDTNMNTVTQSTSAVANQAECDVALCTIDRYSQGTAAYLLTSKRDLQAIYPPSDNVLRKIPMSGLVPSTWTANTNYDFSELGSPNYVGVPTILFGVMWNSTGYNGITASPQYLYTYDSDSLHRWDKTTGALLGGWDVSALPRKVSSNGNGSARMELHWGGLDVDDCDNLYIGVGKEIKVYDASMNLTNTIPVQDTVYDVRVGVNNGVNNKIYACGRGFAAEINVVLPPTSTSTVTISSTPATGCNACDGTAAVTALQSPACATPPPFEYLWAPGGQTTSAISNLCPGTYSCTLSRWCKPVQTQTVLITGGGTVSVTATSTPDSCAKNVGVATANVSTGTAPYTYAWSPSGGTNASATGLSSGNYSVTVTSSNGCTAVTTVSVSATGSLTAAAGPSSTICAGQTASINGSGGGNYLWSNGQTTAAINVTPPATTTYTLVVSSGGCKDTAFATVSVNALPVANALGSTICAGQTTALNASGGGTYLWSNGNTNSSINISPTTNTTYSVVVTLNGCSDTAAASVTVNPLPVVIISNSTICIGDAVTITATGGGTYSWSTGATTASISTTPAATSSYSVLVTDVQGCSTTAMDTVFVAPPPVALATSATICSGQSVSLAASGGGNYSWSNGNTNSSISVTPTATSNYSVVVSIGSCRDTAYSSVLVNQSPVVSLGLDPTICVGQSVSLDAGNPGASYVWSTGQITQTIDVSAVGNYWVIVALNNCLDMDTVTVVTAPVIQLFDSSLCTTSPIVLDPGSGATSYYWSTGSTTQTISVDTAGSYWVTVMFGNCAATAAATITGMPGGEGGLYIPNCFTPNGDHLNDVFLAKGEGITSFDMSIFDRWGNLLFVSSDVHDGWSGKIQGGHYIFKGDGSDVSQEDVYIWRIDYKTQCFPKKSNKIMGHVSIVK